MKPTVVALVGPTCTGKTALSLKLSGHFSGEIINCDSRAIYRYMDIGTAKPSKEERKRIPHHMLDVVDPDEVFTVTQFKEQGRECIDEIVSRNHIPIVCGGTGFYARALLEGLNIPDVPPQADLRAKLRSLAEAEGNEALHMQLQEVDPQSAARIGVNDLFRIVRALEVCTVTGKPFSELATMDESPYRVAWIGLTMADRSKLHKLIADRFHDQMHQGMLEEVEWLLDRFGPTQSILNTINYKELSQYLRGEISLEQASNDCIRHNRQLARRQLIWFRKNKLINWFNVDEVPSDVLFQQTLATVKSEFEDVSVN